MDDDELDELRHSGFGKEAKSEREAAQRSFFQTVKV